MKLCFFPLLLFFNLSYCNTNSNEVDTVDLSNDLLIYTKTTDIDEYSFFLNEFNINYQEIKLNQKTYFILKNVSLEQIKSYVFTDLNDGSVIEEYSFTDSLCSTNKKIIFNYINSFLSNDQPFMYYKRRSNKAILLCFNYSNSYDRPSLPFDFFSITPSRQTD